MRQVLLALLLIAVPSVLFALGYDLLARPMPDGQPALASALGEMADLKAIAADTAQIIAKGDLATAGRRITDFETAWDDQEATLRPLSEEDWGRVDAAADVAIQSLRASSPDPDAAASAVAGLVAALADPTGHGTASTGAQLVAGIAVTDGAGHAIPCEEMIKSVQAGLSDAAATVAGKTSAQDLLSKALERCNADDDTHADAFSAQALAALAAR